MTTYSSSFIRYEMGKFHYSERGISIKIITPSKFTKEWVNEKFVTTRVTIVPFPVPESHYLSSAELDGWGSCSVKGESNFPPKREQLIVMGYVRPGLVMLDAAAWRSHRRERYLIDRTNRTKTKPIDTSPCSCGVCNKCAQKWSDQFETS